MTAEIKKPHVEFSMSGSPIHAALQSLGIGDDAARREAAESKSWPLQDAWEAHRGARAGRIHRALPQAQRAAIESLLESVEKGFSSWLEGKQSAPDAAALRRIAEELAGAEALIYGGSHQTFPYFARYFLLEVAILGQRLAIGDATGADQLAKVKLWWRSRGYLQAAFQSAYAERAGEIVLRSTGALRDRVYVEDAHIRTALTVDVVAGGQDEIELQRVREHLANAAAWQYVQDLEIEEGARILAYAHASITVTANSKTRQEQLVDAAKFWPAQQQTIEAGIAASRAACGLALGRLAIGGTLPSAPVPRPEPQVRAPEYWGYLELLIPGVIGCIPYVGAAVAGAYASYLKFLGGLIYPQAPNPLIELERKMEALIHDKIAEADARWINNMITGIEDEIKKLMKACEADPAAGLEDPALKTRAINLYQEVLLNKYHLLQPSSGSYYKVAPYSWRFFMCFMITNELAERFGDKRDFLGERKTFYGDLERLVHQSINGISIERRSRISIKETAGSCGTAGLFEVYDYRVEKSYSTNLNGFSAPDTALRACQWAAGMATGIQFMREMTRDINDVIVRDTAVTNTSATGFRPNAFTHIFSQSVHYQQGNCQWEYDYLRQLGRESIVNADVGRMNDASEMQRQLAETHFPGTTVFTI